MVEMAIVSVVLFTLLFGIITYAYMMSFRQSMTQAAAEGARAGAVAISEAAAETDGSAALEAAVDEFHDCDGAMSCEVEIDDCPAPSVKRCVFATVSYDYDDDPLLPAFPGFGLVLPDELEARSVAEISVEP